MACAHKTVLFAVLLANLSLSAADKADAAISIHAWKDTFTYCPAFGKYEADACSNRESSGKCDRPPNKEEAADICDDFKNKPKCAKDALAKKHLGWCFQYKYKIVFPSCRRGFWDSGCGQPVVRQSGVVTCYARRGPKSWAVANDQDCADAGIIKPSPTDRLCPATPPCPRCKGCRRDGGCWKICGGKAGKCNACASRTGRHGACCRRGAKDDPIECKLAEFQFKSDKVHTCALLPVDSHVVNVMAAIFRSAAKDLETSAAEAQAKNKKNKKGGLK